jgi:hypothetical protein
VCEAQRVLGLLDACLALLTRPIEAAATTDKTNTPD